MVRRGLKALFEAATDLREYKKSFELTGKPPKWVGLLTDGDDDRLRGKPPNWVRLLTDGDDDRESLTSEMREYGLRGVAVLAQTDERLD